MSEHLKGTASEYGHRYLVYFTNYIGEKRRNVGVYGEKYTAEDQIRYLDRIHNKDVDDSDPNQRKFFAIEDIRMMDIQDYLEIEVRSLPRND